MRVMYSISLYRFVRKLICCTKVQNVQLKPFTPLVLTTYSNIWEPWCLALSWKRSFDEVSRMLLELELLASTEAQGVGAIILSTIALSFNLRLEHGNLQSTGLQHRFIWDSMLWQKINFSNNTWNTCLIINNTCQLLYAIQQLVTILDCFLKQQDVRYKHQGLTW